MSKCLQCGAPLSQHGNYGYCGYVASGNIRQIITEQQNNRQECLNTLQNNLDFLYELPKPNIGKEFKAVFRVIVAIYTLGLGLLIWKKQKKHLNLAEYKKT